MNGATPGGLLVPNVATRASYYGPGYYWNNLRPSTCKFLPLFCGLSRNVLDSGQTLLLPRQLDHKPLFCSPYLHFYLNIETTFIHTHGYTVHILCQNHTWFDYRKRRKIWFLQMGFQNKRNLLFIRWRRDRINKGVIHFEVNLNLIKTRPYTRRLLSRSVGQGQ